MKRLNIKRVYFLIGTFFLFLITTNCSANIFIKNENIIDERAVKQIELIGKELKEKTGVNTYIIAINSLNKAPLITYEQNLSKTLTEPFILLSLVKEDKQVDIFCSKDMNDKFDKEAILSPYPLNGTILPILASKKGKDKYSAAILNGYADIADQVAESYDINLKTSIGSANKTVINIIKIIFYSLTIFTIIIIIYRKRKRFGRD